MKFKTTAFLLVIAVLLGGYILFYEKKKPTTEEWKEKSKKVFDIKSEQIDKIQIRRGETLILCEKKNGEWDILSPVKDTADAGEIDRILSKIEFLKWERLLKKGEWEAKKEEFGITQPRAELDFWVKDRKSTLRVGKEAALGGNIYLGVEGRDGIYIVSKDLFDAVNKEPDTLRDKTALPLILSDIKRFEITRSAGKISCAREDDAWKLKEPISSDAEESKINGFLGQLRDLKVENFVADGQINLAEYGLEQPQAEVAIFAGADVSGKIIFGSAVKDSNNIYAKREGKKTVYAVKSDILNELNQDALAFKSRTVLKVDKEKIESIKITSKDGAVACYKSGEEWEIREPVKAKAKKEKIDIILGIAGDLKCKEFVAAMPPKLSEYGLDKPDMQIKFTLAGGEEKAVLIGKRKEPDGYYAGIQGKDDIFILNSYDVENLAVKLSDLKAEEEKREDGKEEPPAEGINIDKAE
ncbi:MAG: DUF4340 domain-containing protein [Candidatus Omnitrophica bacterium]|nr:DUF4340 domain-containing protein [Candidatus Omnitrophota bacterium]